MRYTPHSINRKSIAMDPTVLTNMLGLTSEQTAALITLTALSGSFYFVINFIRTPFEKLKNWLHTYFIRQIDLHISEPDYNKVNLWLEKNKDYIKFQRSYKVVTASGKSEDESDYDDESVSKKQKNRLIAGFGTILIWHPNHPLMLVTRTKEEAKQIYNQTESISIQFLTLNPARILTFFNEITTIIENDGPFVYESNDHWWGKRGIPKPVSLPVGDGARAMIASVDKFLASKSEYDSRALAFKRGYLMYGEPGTGKTSIISYIAQKHGLNIYVLNSDSITRFSKIAASIKQNSIVVIEDIDFTVVGSKRKLDDGDDDSDMTVNNKEALHGFLNALDGIVEFNANIIVATTNNRDALDSAMLRPGRIDETFEISVLNSNDQIEHVSRFFGVDIDASDYDLPHRTFAELQLICTSNMMDINATLGALQNERITNNS